MQELSMKLGLAEVPFPDQDAAAAAAPPPAAAAGQRDIIEHAGGGIEELKLELDRHLKSRASHEAPATEDRRRRFKLWSRMEKVHRRRTICILAVLAVAVYIVLVLAGVIIYIATDTFMQQKRLQKEVPIGLSDNVDTLTKLTGTLDSRLKSVESSIGPINTELEKIRTNETQNLRGVAEHVTSIDGTVDTLSKSIKELTQTTQADVVALMEQLAALQRQIQQPPPSQQQQAQPSAQQGVAAPAAPQGN